MKSIKERLNILLELKENINHLILKYEKEMFSYLVDSKDDDNTSTSSKIINSQLKLMQTIEQRTYKRVIDDLEKIINEIK